MAQKKSTSNMKVAKPAKQTKQEMTRKKAFEEGFKPNLIDIINEDLDQYLFVDKIISVRNIVQSVFMYNLDNPEDVKKLELGTRENVNYAYELMKKIKNKLEKLTLENVLADDYAKYLDDIKTTFTVEDIQFKPELYDKMAKALLEQSIIDKVYVQHLKTIHQSLKKLAK